MNQHHIFGNTSSICSAGLEEKTFAHSEKTTTKQVIKTQYLAQQAYSQQKKY